MKDDRIAKFHTLSRKYFIDILNDIENKNLLINKRYNKIYQNNNGDFNKTLEEFEKDITIKSLSDELNEKYPNWIIINEILKVILRKIESKTAEEFDSFNDIKEFILNECNESKINELYHFDISNELKIKICNDEKKKFYDYIDNIDGCQLNNIKPLFYRKVLSESKIHEIEKKIDEACYRHSLGKTSKISFDEVELKIAVKMSELIDILKHHEVSKIYEINTSGIDTASYIMDLYAFNPYFIDGAYNIYWCTEQMDWVIVKEHEGYYFIYGEWLIEEIKKVWKD